MDGRCLLVFAGRSMTELIEQSVQRNMIERRSRHQGNRTIEQEQDEQFAASTGIDPGFACETRIEKGRPAFGQIHRRLPPFATTRVIVVETHHGHSPGSDSSHRLTNRTQMTRMRRKGHNHSQSECNAKRGGFLAGLAVNHETSA